MDDKDSRFRRELQRDADSGVTMTSELISAMLVMMGFGWLADRLLSTAPWLMVLGAILGFGLGFYLVYLRALALGRDEEARRPRL